MERCTFFADVLLPLPLPQLFTYRVPFGMEGEIAVGKRVAVPFAHHHNYAGLIWKVHQKVPDVHIAKYIQSVLDDFPIINDSQIQLWNFISSYYMCSLGDVMNAALPSAFKLQSESSIVLNPDFTGDVSNLNEKEVLVAEALQHQHELKIKDITNITGISKTLNIIKNLYDKQVIYVKEELVEKYKPRKDIYLKLNDIIAESEEKQQEIFNQLEKRAFKQMEVLLQFYSLKNLNKTDLVAKNEVLNAVCKGNTALAELIKKEILIEIEVDTDRIGGKDAQKNIDELELSDKQNRALEEIKAKNQDVVLLHGVTGSGKTEIYCKLISETLRQGKQVLYLLPEIALTNQIIRRLQYFFGKKVGIYHSKFNEQERVEIWKRVMAVGENRYDIILGARSAIMLPFDNLGLIIVDEEHDSSFKQFDPAPRYNARDAAIMLAHIHNAKALLGSATPSLESYYNAQQGKYGLVENFSRYGKAVLPEIIVADLRKEQRNKTMHQNFSSVLLEEIRKALENKEQVILFQNKRGFSQRLECSACGYVPECDNCDVTLIYHKFSNQLKCHYCGLSVAPPNICPKCGNTHLEMKGFGTEKIEDDLKIFFPNVEIKRMDYDSTRSKYAYQDLISDFEQRKIDILVGTQMVTKGLDFDNVSVVGIMNADNLLAYPDFRAFERGFQLMSQVAGRAGRKEKRGKVIIQTFNGEHPIIKNVIGNDFSAMFNTQMKDRADFHYPPLYRLIKISIKHKDFEKTEFAMKIFADMLKEKFGTSILGPNIPLIGKINNYYIKEVILKLDKSESIVKAKRIINEILTKFSSISANKALRIVIDVDPL
ncbi:primosomal protein N' [Bacteroidia bacterium]|nr:primosomal protein N' [Bacteroidia bacterium]